MPYVLAIGFITECAHAGNVKHGIAMTAVVGARHVQKAYPNTISVDTAMTQVLIYSASDKYGIVVRARRFVKRIQPH